jgi:hypothetical protein
MLPAPASTMVRRLSRSQRSLLALAAGIRNDHCGDKAAGSLLLTNRVGAKGPPLSSGNNRFSGGTEIGASLSASIGGSTSLSSCIPNSQGSQPLRLSKRAGALPIRFEIKASLSCCGYHLYFGQRLVTSPEEWPKKGKPRQREAERGHQQLDRNKRGVKNPRTSHATQPKQAPSRSMG